jgi:hypothetical protein
MINKSKLRKKFNDEGIQVSLESLNVLNAEVNRMVDKWVNKAKGANIKRLVPELLGYVIDKR